MKIHSALLFLMLAFSANGSAQENKIFMWFSGDQNKPMPVILLAVDSSSLKSDTIAIYKYLISQSEYGEIRVILLNENFAADSNYISTKLASFDFTILGRGSYMIFFTKKLSLLEKRFSGILEILKLNPHYDAVKRNTNTVLSRLTASETFPR
jgi:hypothetical protein